MTRPCKFCEKPVPRKPKTRKYCSQTCYFADRNLERTRNCGYCGKQFLATHRKADGLIQAEERRLWPPGIPRPKNVRRVPLPNHCKNGHEYTPDNTVLRSDNAGRRCRSCQRETAKRKYAQAIADPVKLERLKAKRKKRQVEKREEMRTYSQAYGRKKTEKRRAERALRPDACKRGHLFTPENTMPRSDGKRRCRTCYQTSQAAAHARVSADPALVEQRRKYHREWMRQNKLKNQSAQASLF